MNVRLSDLSPEMRLLLACARTSVSEEDKRRIRILSREPIDWESFLQMVDRHRLIPMVYRTLTACDDHGFPESVHRILHECCHQNIQRVLGYAAELVRLVKLFDSNGLPVMPLKGPALALQVYGDLGWRTMRDLDLLVFPAQVERAERLLLEAGYKRLFPDFSLSRRQQDVLLQYAGSHFSYRHVERALIVELHWLPWIAIDRWEMERIWSGAQSTVISGISVKTLSPEDTVITLCIHGGQHAWFRLFWLCDLAEFLHKDHAVNWGDLVARATKLGVQRSLAQGLVLAHLLLGTALPDPVRSCAEGDRAMPGLVEEAIRRQKLPENYYVANVAKKCLHLVYLLKLESDLRHRFGILKKYSLISATDWRRFPLPDALFPLYYVLRPFFWLVRQIVR